MQRGPSTASAAQRAGTSSRTAALGALTAAAMSSMLFHEAGNLLLGQPAAGEAALNMRAVSCFAHAASLVLGFALYQLLAQRARKLAGSRWFYLGCFGLHAAAWALFYLAARPAPVAAVAAAQVLGAGSTALFVSGGAQFLPLAGGRGASRGICLVLAGYIALTNLLLGLSELLGAGARLLPTVAAVHALLIAIGALLAVRAARGGLRVPQREWDRIAASSQPEDLLAGRLKPVRVVLAAVFAYGAVFGILHIVPLVVALSPWVRTGTCLGGSVAAIALFLGTFRRPQQHSMPMLWDRFCRFVFSLTVMSVLMAPLTSRSEFVPSLLVYFCALCYYYALVLLGCRIVSEEGGFASDQVMGRVLLVLSAGFLCGNLVGNVIHDHFLDRPELFTVMGAAVFLALFAVTFTVRPERHAKTLWGLLPREDPHGRYSRNLAQRCDELARAAGLTAREREVLELLARGLRPQRISEELVVSVSTVRSHVRGVYVKLGVHSHDELMELVS